MIQASLYILVCTARNRLRLRLRRLREPRYLLGAVAGVAYLYVSVFARMRARSTATGRRGDGLAAPAVAMALAAVGPALAGLVLLAAAIGAWALPFESGLLEFTDTEVQFLFPAPVSRRALLVHRLVRSQAGLLFGAIVMGLFLPSGSGYQRLRVAVGMWMLMATARVYFAIVTLTRTGFASGAAGARRAAVGAGALVLAVAGLVLAVAVRSVAERPIAGAGDMVARVTASVSTGLPHLAVWPFVAMARPMFADGWGAFAQAIPGSLLVLSVAVAWMLRSDERFRDAAAVVADRREGEKGARTASYRARAMPWMLAPRGRPEVAFAWKGAAQVLRVVDRRTFLRIAILLAVLGLAGLSLGGRSNGFAATLGGFGAIVALFTVLMAPQTLRTDLRQDLGHLDLLKTWPLRGPDVVRGEMLWPGMMLTGIAWAAMAMASLLFAAAPGAGAGPVWVAIAGAVLAPALIFAQLTIHNAAALMFPAWVPLGHQRPRGLDAMGQRLIILGGTWLLLALATLPGGLAGAAVWFAFRGFLGAASLVPAALACSAALAAEVLLATEALGPAYDRLDLLATDRGED